MGLCISSLGPILLKVISVWTNTQKCCDMKIFNAMGLIFIGLGLSLGKIKQQGLSTKFLNFVVGFEKLYVWDLTPKA